MHPIKNPKKLIEVTLPLDAIIEVIVGVEEFHGRACRDFSGGDFA